MEFTSAEDACYEPDIRGGVQLQKKDLETGLSVPLAGGSLAGIRYQIINRSAHSVMNKDGMIIPNDGRTAVQVIETDDKGVAKTGRYDLPYGTYVLREMTRDDLKLSSNESYLNQGAKDLVFRIREDGTVVTADTDGKTLVFRNQIKRNHLELRKVDEDDERMGEIPFLITQLETGEQHVIVTDENGNYSSKRYKATRFTNANDYMMEGYDETTGADVGRANVRSSVWFGLSGDGETMAQPNDDLAPFPYGSYTLTELRCANNEGFDLIRDYRFEIREDGSEDSETGVVLNNLHNKISIPTPGYSMSKARVDKAPAGSVAGTFGFRRGDVVTYRITIKNTGKTDLTMDVDDAFADAQFFEDVRIDSATIDGRKAIKGQQRSPAEATLFIPEGKTCVVTVSARIAGNTPEYLAPETSDNRNDPEDGYVNVARTMNVIASYKDAKGRLRTLTASEFPQELADRQDTANTPVRLVPGYEITKKRKTTALQKLAEGFGFRRGDEVEYEITVTNTGETDLTMDVEDTFAESEFFTDVTFVSATVDNASAAVNSLPDGTKASIKVPEGKACVILVNARITDLAKEYLSPTADDDKKLDLDGYTNTVVTKNIRGIYRDHRGEKKIVTTRDFPKELAEKKDSANTPVQLRPGYILEKKRVTNAPAAGPGLYGFRRGDRVTYEITVTNTGEMDLEMDVSDAFVDRDYFTDLTFTDITIDGKSLMENGPDAKSVAKDSAQDHVHIALPEGATGVITVTAVVSKEAVELLAASAEDDRECRDGFTNIARVYNVTGTYTPYDPTDPHADPQLSTRTITEKDDPELAPKEDTADTPVQLVPSYEIRKSRVDKAPAAQPAGSYGFKAGDTVTYKVEVENTGDGKLMMDIVDSFEDGAKFEELTYVSAEVEGRNVATNALPSGEKAGIEVPERSTAEIIITAKVSKGNKEYLANAADDDRENAEDGYVNTVRSDDPKAEIPTPDGPRLVPAPPGEDKSNTPVRLVPSYALRKTRISAAPSDGNGKYGFRADDTVSYEIEVENTGDMELTMDVTDSFAESGAFTKLTYVSAKIDGRNVAENKLPARDRAEIRVPAGETAVVTVTAEVSGSAKASLAAAAADTGEGYVNTAKADKVTGYYIDRSGKERKVTQKDYPDELASKEDTAHTPVQKPGPASTPAPTPPTTKGSAPVAPVRTGDENRGGILLALAGSAATLALLLRRRRVL